MLENVIKIKIKKSSEITLFLNGISVKTCLKTMFGKHSFLTPMKNRIQKTVFSTVS